MRYAESRMGAALLFAAVLAGCQASPPRFAREVPWHGRGVWLRADTHTHTRFSDGEHTVEQLVAKAEEFGCDVVSITDHSDHNLTAATPEYFAAIEAARRAHPRVVVLAGVEWNIPPWGGDEHATVHVLPGAEPMLTRFKQQFDDLDRPEHDRALAAQGLQWLAENATVDGLPPVVVYEHPSRKDARSIENVPDIEFWRGINDVVIGFAGAPGHQGAKPLGSYSYKETPIDRWDPVAARVGDAWDTLLGKGLDVWAAYAPSDFHNARPEGLRDLWPCQFSETWLYAPDRSAAGALRALRAGSFFGSHGGIVREVELKVRVDGLPRAAGAGEAITAPPGSKVTAELQLVVPAKAFPDGANHVDRVELIAVAGGSAQVVAEAAPKPEGAALAHALVLPRGGLVLRARGARVLETGERLMFYTNPVRVIARRF